MRDNWHSRFPNRVERPSFMEYVTWLGRSRRNTPAVREALARAEEVIARHCLIAYISGALTGMPDEIKIRYAKTSEICERHNVFGYAPHLYGTDPVKHPSVTPGEVRDIDYLWAVVLANVHIYFTDPTSDGVGIEGGWGEVYCTPAVRCTPANHDAVRLRRGLINTCLVIEYANDEELYREIEKAVIKIKTLSL